MAQQPKKDVVNTMGLQTLADTISTVAKSAVTAAKSAVTFDSSHQHTLLANGATPDDHKMQATAKVFHAIQGHWLSASLGVMLQLKVADILLDHEAGQTPMGTSAQATNTPILTGDGAAFGNGIATADDSAHANGSVNAQTSGMPIKQLAAACGCNSATAQSHLYKVLRVLAQHELLEELPGKVFAPNAATAELVQGDQPSLGHMAAHLINKPKWDAWKVLPEAVQQGKTAFVMAHGLDVYQFGELPEQAAFGDEFCKAMSYFTRHSLTGGRTSLKDAYDWSGARVILDVGGGRGELLSAVMSWSRDHCKGLILDRQMVIDSIDTQSMFGGKGVMDAASRLTLMAGDVRKPFPQAAHHAQVDTLLMKHFLSAFSDEDSVLIIKHCKQVLIPGGSILLLQTLVPEAGDRAHNACEDGVAPGLFAIEILAQCPGGAWRTLSEWEELFGKGGMQLQSNTAVGCNMNLMVWK